MKFKILDIQTFETPLEDFFLLDPEFLENCDLGFLSDIFGDD